MYVAAAVGLVASVFLDVSVHVSLAQALDLVEATHVDLKGWNPAEKANQLVWPSEVVTSAGTNSRTSVILTLYGDGFPECTIFVP